MALPRTPRNSRSGKRVRSRPAKIISPPVTRAFSGINPINATTVDALATGGLADDAEDLARGDVETDVADGIERTAPCITSQES